ncbi:MAG TPA: DUF3368 domain-containing protein [Candidatus Cloacimonadota bacterium]|nr:DUF3368 domain-containing protein [Candidatus Cloacimonadota bacterium]
MDLLISDTCILIDLCNGGLLEKMSELPYNLGVPDAILSGFFDDETELINPNAEEIIHAGFQVFSLDYEGLMEVFELNQKYSKPSLNDIFGLVVAKKHNAILLTGDGSLRKSAVKENVDVKGILWIMDEMIDNKIIDMQTASARLQKILDEGSFLPKSECDKRFEKWENQDE